MGVFKQEDKHVQYKKAEKLQVFRHKLSIRQLRHALIHQSRHSEGRAACRCRR
jgi:hypothetical protein